MSAGGSSVGGLYKSVVSGSVLSGLSKARVSESNVYSAETTIVALTPAARYGVTSVPNSHTLSRMVIAWIATLEAARVVAEVNSSSANCE